MGQEAKILMKQHGRILMSENYTENKLYIITNINLIFVLFNPLEDEKFKTKKIEVENTNRFFFCWVISYQEFRLLI